MIGTRKEWPASDVRYMKRALELARLALGNTSPNPAVGAVLVKNGVVMAEGYHHEYGKAHAEIDALNRLEDPASARGATLYVTLEPCCHWGKTPPCTDTIVKSGIARVVITHLDSYAEVAGRGAKILRDAGIHVEVGLLATEATRLNAGFLMRNRHRRPFVTAKWAMTLDGRISATSGDSRWISSNLSRRHVHALRAESDAVLVGIGTVLHDNPRLNVRLPGYVGRQPKRVIIDAHLKTPFKAALFEAEPAGQAVIITSELARDDVMHRFRQMGVEVIVVPHDHGMIDVRTGVRELADRGIQTLLIEGGGQVNGTFLREGLIDQVVAFVSPKIIGGSGARTPIEGFGGTTMKDALTLTNLNVTAFGGDLCVSGYVAKPDALEGLYEDGEECQTLFAHSSSE